MPGYYPLAWLSLDEGLAVVYTYTTLRLGQSTTVFPKATPVAGITPSLTISSKNITDKTDYLL